MERIPQQLEGTQTDPTELPLDGVEETTPTTDGQESWDERVIRESIEAAVSEGRPIDDRTARYIAGQLHGGQSSALYALASGGAVLPEVFAELDQDRTEQPAAVRGWLACLTVYCAVRGESGPIAGWAEQAGTQDQADLMARIAAGSVGTLGELAVVHTPEASTTDADEVDTFSWSDAARWSPDDDTEAVVERVSGLSAEQLDALFDDGADEEIGAVEDLGWYGLVRWTDQPGGLILKLDTYGRRQTWVVQDNDNLATRWTSVTAEYSAFYEEREAYAQAIAEPDYTPSGSAPRIWVGSLADYNNGYLHGEWFDAAREANELELATKFMLRRSRMPEAEEWAVMDYDGFGPLRLGEYASFETISRIANGIAEHGEAFAAWAAHVGPESTDLLDRFQDHYRGEWESFEAYVEEYLQETGFYRFLDKAPEDMRGYIEVDVEQIARDWGGDYEVVERPGSGGVWVFEPNS